MAGYKAIFFSLSNEGGKKERRKKCLALQYNSKYNRIGGSGLSEMVAVCGLDCNECGAFLAIKERDGNLVSDRYFWIREPKTP